MKFAEFSFFFGSFLFPNKKEHRSPSVFRPGQKNPGGENPPEVESFFFLGLDQIFMATSQACQMTVRRLPTFEASPMTFTPLVATGAGL